MAGPRGLPQRLGGDGGLHVRRQRLPRLRPQEMTDINHCGLHAEGQLH
jgi:hypothetical protein